MSVRLPEAGTHVPGVCPLDCPDACSLDVTVADGRVAAIGGSRVNPVTEGYICAKVRRYPELVHGERRVLHPRVRVGRKGEGRFREASWDEALALVARKLLEVREKQGGEAILPVSYGGSNGYLSQDTTDARLFYRLGASCLARTVCAAPSGAAAMGMTGKMPGIAIQDYAHAKLVVLWGVNPSVSGIHLVPYVQEAVKRGARLVVLDPRRTKLAERADLHLALRPGTDLPVALSVIRWLFTTGHADEGFLAKHTTGAEELKRRASAWTFARAAEVARVAAADLERFAQMYAEASPAALRCGWGLERNRNGGSAVAAVLALPAVAGKFGVRGGGYTMSNARAFDINPLAAVRAERPATREINMNLLGEALLSREKPVRLLFVYNNNPLQTLPAQEKVRRGLEREDLFTVVFDPVLTDTALYADVVLPATTFLEREELSRGYGALVLQHGRPAIAPVGESRPNHEVFAELCRRTGVAAPGDPETAEEIVAALLGSSREKEALAAALERDGVAFPGGLAAPVQFVDVFPRTPDRRMRLVPEELDREAPEGLYAYRLEPARAGHPLALISPATDRMISSSLGELYDEQFPLELPPADARARGIANGDTVRVWNEQGEVRCVARVSASLKAGVAMLPKGLWRHHTLSGTTANALAPDTLADLGGGACFNDARVEVERVPA
jgi:anaerobic selenocysteine-containing dehydrogenase